MFEDILNNKREENTYYCWVCEKHGKINDKTLTIRGGLNDGIYCLECIKENKGSAKELKDLRHRDEKCLKI